MRVSSPVSIARTVTAFSATKPPPHLVRSPLVVFDVSSKAAQKARAAAAVDAADFDYLRDEIAARVVDRLCDMRRTFPNALDLFCGSGHVARALRDVENKPGVGRLAHADVAEEVVARAPVGQFGGFQCAPGFVFREDEAEAGWKEPELKEGTLDLVISSGGLHWVNDLPGVLARVNALLRPDGLFLGAMYGGETLRELRVSMQLAEEELRGGISPHVSPMVHPPDAGNVLQRAGLKLTTVDLDEIVVPFRDMRAVMKHLKGMGEANAVITRRLHYGRKLFHRAAEIYQERFGFVDGQGRPCVPATFQIVHMVGWAPDDSQPGAKPAGSATVSFGDLAETVNAGSTSRDAPS